MILDNSYLVQTANRTYRVVDDRTALFQALVLGRLQSITGDPLSVAALTVDHPDVFVKLIDGGHFCLAGRPELVMPQLPTTPYAFSLTATADFHDSRSVLITVPAGSGLPFTYSTTVELPYLPTRIQGRIRAANGIAAAGAAVTTKDNTILLLRTPLHFAHVPGNTVNPITIGGGPPAPETTVFHTAALQGESIITLADRSSLSSGDVLQLGPDHSAEYVVIASIVGNPALPGEVNLRMLLQRSRAIDDPVWLVSVTSAVSGSNPSRTLAHPVSAGDGLITLNSLGGTNPALTAVEIVGATPDQTEYHVVGGLSDSEGFYNLDSIGRYGRLELQAKNSGSTQMQEQLWLLDVSKRLSIMNFKLKPNP